MSSSHSSFRCTLSKSAYVCWGFGASFQPWGNQAHVLQSIYSNFGTLLLHGHEPLFFLITRVAVAPTPFNANTTQFGLIGLHYYFADAACFFVCVFLCDGLALVVFLSITCKLHRCQEILLVRGQSNAKPPCLFCYKMWEPMTNQWLMFTFLPYLPCANFPDFWLNGRDPLIFQASMTWGQYWDVQQQKSQGKD